jgi:DNA mismatch endonuclease, patch repair protein
VGLTRSEQMARIRSRNTRPEVLLGSLLWRGGARYRKHAVTPVGRPDFVFAGRKLAVFVDGCQWHGCPEHYVRPRTRNAFWDRKLDENVARDVRQTRELETAGWRVIRVWEHDLWRDAATAARVVLDALKESAPSPGSPPSWRVFRVELIDAAADLERRHLVELHGPAEPHTVLRKRTTSKR